jgi:hypothetical protein
MVNSSCGSSFFSPRPGVFDGEALATTSAQNKQGAAVCNRRPNKTAVGKLPLLESGFLRLGTLGRSLIRQVLMPAFSVLSFVRAE